MQLRQTARAPTFGDVKPYKGRRRGEKPGHVFLIAPHSHENIAVLPFTEALSKKLESEGIIVSLRPVNDIHLRAGPIRKHIQSNPREFYNETVVSAILSLEDHVLRFAHIRDCINLVQGPSIVVEMHAHACDNNNYPLSSANKWRRLGRTHILIMRTDPFTFAADALFSDIEIIGSNMEMAKRIAALRNIDLKDLVYEYTSLGVQLKPHKHTLMAFELPSSIRLMAYEHPLFSLYHTPDGCLKSISAFEDSYSATVFEPFCFNEVDIEAVARILRHQ